jgi:small subunit ribosomal protein S29
MLTVNKKAFMEIKLSEDLVLEKQTLKKGATLKEVVDVAIVDRKRSTAQAPLILDAVMRSLEVQTLYVVIY